MGLKTAPTHRDVTDREMKRHEEQIQLLLKNGEEYLKESIAKWLTSREKNFYEPIRRYVTYSNHHRKEEKPKEISKLKEYW